MSENLAKRYLEEGKIGQALNVLERDATRLTQVIQDYLGLQHQEGQQVVRLPYYRALKMLNPHKPTRRSEQHIIRQVFSGLTKLDENEQVQGDLAHDWEMITAKHWRFYIRPVSVVIMGICSRRRMLYKACHIQRVVRCLIILTR